MKVKRAAEEELATWLASPRRLPLVLRGARQVGKTWLVRELARSQGRALLELNLERDPRLRGAFQANDPRVILGEVEIATGRAIDASNALLFLDEIQAAPELLAKLRWFAEELPELPVVAAGSLLDLVLAGSAVGVPVGRIQYRHIEPLGFDEFLGAHGQTRLLASLDAWRPGADLSGIVHARATEWWDRFAMVGGMPAVVAADVSGAEPRACREVQRELAATFRDDFGKYGTRMSRDVLDAVLLAAVRSIGRKFVHERVGPAIKGPQAKRALELLVAAKLCHLVTHTAANGLPLGGEAKPQSRKVVLLDVGLVHAWLGTPATRVFPGREQLSSALRAQLAEQLAAQALRLFEPPSGDGPRLFYWHREGGRPGEVDYVVALGGRVLPVEIKSGSAGAMKSLHQFMADKGLDLAVRVDANPPSSMTVNVATTQGDRARYTLLSLPLYLLHRLPDLVAG